MSQRVQSILHAALRQLFLLAPQSWLHARRVWFLFVSFHLLNRWTLLTTLLSISLSSLGCLLANLLLPAIVCSSVPRSLTVSKLLSASIANNSPSVPNCGMHVALLLFLHVAFLRWLRLHARELYLKRVSIVIAGKTWTRTGWVARSQRENTCTSCRLKETAIGNKLHFMRECLRGGVVGQRTLAAVSVKKNLFRKRFLPLGRAAAPLRTKWSV